MQPIQDAQQRRHDADDQRRTLRSRQADRLDVLVAASQVEDLCPHWIADRLSERERMSS